MSFDTIANSPMLWDPIRLHEACPSSDGACALVLTSERSVRKTKYAPAWIHATSMRSEPTQFAGQEKVNPQAGRDCAKDVYKKAGISDPRKQIDMAEIYVPFSWFEPMWMENLGFAPVGEGWKMTYEGATALDGDMPVNCSGGVLSSNPIGASGMIRFAEAAMQVRGQAGEHQVDGARIALGHAYGGGSQFFSMWIVGGSAEAVDEQRAAPIDVQPRRPLRVGRRRGSRAHRARVWRAATDLRAARPAREPVRACARRARREGRRRRRALPDERRRVHRGDDRLLQDACGPGERELPLRRRRAALPARRRGRGRRDPPAQLRAPSRHRARPTPAPAHGALGGRRQRRRSLGRRLGGLRVGARRRRTRARLRGAFAGRSLHALHRRHHGHAEGRDVAPGRHLLLRHARREPDRPAALATRGSGRARRGGNTECGHDGGAA